MLWEGETTFHRGILDLWTRWPGTREDGQGLAVQREKKDFSGKGNVRGKDTGAVS